MGVTIVLYDLEQIFMSSTRKITSEDFFRVLKHRVPFTFFKSHINTDKKIEIFKETIDALKHIEIFADAVRNGVLDEADLAHQFESEKFSNKLGAVCQQFNDIRFYQKVLIWSNIFVSPNLKIVLKHFRLLNKQFKLQLLEKFGPEERLNEPRKRALEKAYDEGAFVYIHSSKKIPWTTANFPLEQCSELIESVRAEGLRQEATIAALNEECYQSIKKVNLDFDSLLEEQSSVYVLTLDIRITNNFKVMQPFLEQTLNNTDFVNIIAIRNSINQLNDCLYGLTKIEPDFHSGINLHCILIFKSSSDIVEQQIVDELYELLRRNIGTIYSIKIRNWNTVIQNNYDKNAVGLIQKSQKKNVEAFKYWIVNYFFTFDMYLKFDLSKFLDKQISINHCFQNNLNQSQDEKKSLSDHSGQKITLVKNIELKKAIKVQQILSTITKPLVSDKELKKVWRISHLPATARKRVQVANRYYSNSETDQKLVDFLQKIDIFIETIMHYKVEAFDYCGGSDVEMIEKIALQRSMTLLGKQFISLSVPLFPVEYISRHHQLLNNLKIFDLSAQSRHIFSKPSIARTFIDSINTQIDLLRIQLKMPWSELDSKSIAKYRSFQYEQYNRRLKSAMDYLKPIFCQNCMVYRIKVSLKLKDEFTDQKKFSKFFTKFLHHAQRAKPLYWKAGYLGLWQEDAENQSYIDMFLFLDHRSFRYNVIEMLNEQWSDFIFNSLKMDNDVKKEDLIELAEVKGQIIMSSVRARNEYSKESMLIEVSNTDRKKAFLDQIIPIFLSSDIFQKKPKQVAAKALIKGSGEKKKNTKAEESAVSSDE